MDIKTVGVIGAGQMGNGIAHVMALAGYDVTLNDLSQDALTAALAKIEKNMVRQVSRNLITEADMQAGLARISPALDVAALGTADLVIESATENEDIKTRSSKASYPTCPSTRSSHQTPPRSRSPASPHARTAPKSSWAFTL